MNTQVVSQISVGFSQTVVHKTPSVLALTVALSWAGPRRPASART